MKLNHPLWFLFRFDPQRWEQRRKLGFFGYTALIFIPLVLSPVVTCFLLGYLVTGQIGIGAVQEAAKFIPGFWIGMTFFFVFSAIFGLALPILSWHYFEWLRSRRTDE